jgi:hypothetical protein
VQSYVSVNINTGKWYASCVTCNGSALNGTLGCYWSPLVCKVPNQIPKCIIPKNISDQFGINLDYPQYFDLTKKCYYNVYIMPQAISAGYVMDKNTCASATKDVNLSREFFQL